MMNGINTREMVLNILLEIEEGEHSHIAKIGRAHV